MPFSKENRISTFNGIFFVTLFALSSCYLSQLSIFSQYGVSPLIVAIVLGIFYSNTLSHQLPISWVPGIQFVSKRVLRLAIVLYGFRLTLQEVVMLGWGAVFLDLLMVFSTLLLGFWIGTRFLRLDKHLSLLIAAGSAICGAAAVLAVEGVIKSESYKASVAVATVVIFGTLSMFLYPLLIKLGWVVMPSQMYGVWIGASVHEVAQVVVAGSQLSPQAEYTAVVVKMTRVLLLVPVLFILSYFETKNTHQKGFVVPWFALGFLGVIVINSAKIIPYQLVEFLASLDIFLLTMAMSAIGMETHFAKIKHVGGKPFYLAALLFIWLGGASFFYIRYW